MDREGHEDTKFFIGTEVEHTPAHGQRTLFVVGYQPKEEILARALNNACPHIYLGANQSFHPKDSEAWAAWDTLLSDMLKEGIWVTLDFDVSLVEEVLECGMTDYNTFIPMISVKLPYIKQLGYNATLKLDDKDFKATNPGVWCHSVHELQTRKTFTDWTKYTQDEIID
jgi:hypothetical protein